MEKVLITGASKGIGLSIAKKLIEEGYKVYGTCRNPENVDSKIEGLHYIKLDLSKPFDAQTLYEATGPIDILINNAGQSQIGAMEDTDIINYKALFDINVFGLIEVCKTYLPSMRTKQKGTILNIGSLTGKFPLPFYSAYVGSKYAVEGITQSLRIELESFGIKVVLIDPNDIKTSITPTFLCPQESAYFEKANKIKNKVKSKMSNASSADVISQAVSKIIQLKNPKPVYNLGGNAKILVFLKRIVSTRFLHKSIAKTYDLS